MKYLTTPKKIAAFAVIVAVLIVPVYLAFNDQGVQDAISSIGSQNGAGNLENYISGSARYNTAEKPADEQVEPGTPEPPVISSTERTIETNVIAGSFMVVPTPKPEPTPTPKWAPAHPATDGELLIGGLVEEDSVNVLIIGVDRTAYLADTMGIVSISESKQSVKLIMFSRDLYIGYADDVIKNLEKLRHNKLPGVYKINNTYNIAKNTEKYAEGIVYNDNRFENHAYDFLAQVIYEKFDIWVDDFVQINTYGLVKLVDIFGGVRVYVPVYMNYNDPDQNLNIHISKGTQVLNGSQAEGFVRFRLGYDSNGNLNVNTDRTKNQVAFLKAFYEQHAKLSNIDKIPDVINTLKKNIVHSISADDIFTKYIDILTSVVNDSYTFESVEFKLRDKRINGSAYYIIEGIVEAPETGG